VPYGGPPAGPASYAGWWQRVGATFIDGLIAVVFMIPGFVALFAGPTEIKWQDDGPDGPGLYEVPTAGTLGLTFLLFGVAALIFIVIYCRMVGRSGQSWGRKATGYKVLDANTRQPIGAWKVFGRYLLTFVNTLPCYLGFLWPLWDAEKRTFTDMIFSTRAYKA